MPNNLFPYPGNKARHSEWIIQHIPEHTCYVEPFGGAAGVLFNKPKSKVEVYNDLDGDIVHFFKVLRDRGDELQEWLEYVPFSRQLHEEWATAFYEGKRPDDDIKRAGQFFYLRYSQWGGKLNGDNGFCTSARPSNKATNFSRKSERLSAFSDRIREVVIENLTWEDIVGKYDMPETLFYCDPPYVGTEDYYPDGTFDHRIFAKRMTDIDGMVIISYDTIPRFYSEQWSVVSRKSDHVIDGRSGHKEATEYLIMNFDANGEPLMSDVGQQGLDAYTDGGQRQ